MHTAHKILIPTVALLLGAGAVGYQAFAQTSASQGQIPAAVSISTQAQAQVEVADPVDASGQAEGADVETNDTVSASVQAEATSGSSSEPADAAETPDVPGAADVQNAD